MNEVLESLIRPCPENVCDGTGMVLDYYLGEQACPCMIDHAAEPKRDEV